MGTNNIGATGGLKPTSIARAQARQDARRAGAGAGRGARLFDLGEALLSAERAGENLPTLTDDDIGQILTGNTGTIKLTSLLRAKARQQARRARGDVHAMQLGTRAKAGAIAAIAGVAADAQALRRLVGAATGTARGLGRL